MSVYCRNGVWYVNLPSGSSPTRKRFRVAVGRDKQEAVEYEARLRLQARNERLFKDSPGAHRSFEELFGLMMEEYSELHHRESSRQRHYVSYKNLFKVFGNRFISTINAREIEGYKLKRKRDGVSNATINRELATLRMCLRMAVRWEWLQDTPFKSVQFLREPEGRKRFLSPDEFEGLIAAMPKTLADICTLAVATGMRMGEIRFLTWQQVNVKDGIITLPGSGTKNHCDRIVSLNETAERVIRSQTRRIDVPYVFFNPQTGKPRAKLSHHFSKCAARAGIKDIRFHDLRHTFCSWSVLYGNADLNMLRELVGHKTMRMVQRYTHLTTEAKKNMVKKIDFVFEKKLF